MKSSFIKTISIRGWAEIGELKGCVAAAPCSNARNLDDVYDVVPDICRRVQICCTVLPQRNGIVGGKQSVSSGRRAYPRDGK